MDFIKNSTKEKKIFYTFLLIHFIVWSCIGLIRVVMPTDALEVIYWGSSFDLGTPKHPPLAAILAYLAYIPIKHDIIIYMLSQLFVFLGFVYIYKLAKCFLDKRKSILSVIILEGCWVYSYITGYYGFNPDVVLLFTLPCITYYFYKCMNENRKTNWIKLGIFVGFSFLNKYQTATIILPMLIYAYIYKRDIFKSIRLYAAIILAFLIFLPHLWWLIEFDFLPFGYFSGQLAATKWYYHITMPLQFIFMQFILNIGTLVIFFAAKLKFKSPIKLNTSLSKKDTIFILLMGGCPILIHVIMIIISGDMYPRWGFVFWYMIGIMLYYFIQTKITEKEFKFTALLSYIVMFIIFLSLATLLSVEKNYRSRYPVDKIYNDINEKWQEKYHTQIKYVGGYIEWTLPLTIYAKDHPKTVLYTFSDAKNPWIDEPDMKKSGVFIIDRDYDYVSMYTHIVCPYLPDSYKITPTQYKFNVYNAFHQPREYTIYYFFVPPNAIR